MNRLMLVLLIAAGITESLFAVEPALTNLGYIVVSPNGPSDGGDYGPGTPGTQTSGIQEAFDYAVNHKKEVYIIGGGADSNGQPVVYNINTTLHIPWGQDWHCDGGNYVMNFTQTSGDCLVIDSQMSCFFRFGQIVAANLQSGSVVKLHPTSIGPDGFNILGTTIMEFTGIAGGPGAIGLYLLADTLPNGNITDGLEIRVRSISGCATGVRMEGNRGLWNIALDCQRIQGCDTGIHIVNGDYNRIYAGLESLGSTSVIGARISGGTKNELHLRWLNTYGAGKAMVFDGSSANNVVYATNLPVTGISNTSSSNTNLVLPVEPVGLSVITPSMPANTVYAPNTTNYRVAVLILSAGNVSSWNIKDAMGAATSNIAGPLRAGQTILLEPGEEIQFTYTSAPTWVWRALR